MWPTAFLWVAVIWMGATGAFLALVVFVLIDIRDALRERG